MNGKTLQKIKNFESIKVLIIGEAMLDKFLNGPAKRLNREAPVPVVEVKNHLETPGGAANTAVNVVDMGGQVKFISVVGKDSEAESLKKTLEKKGVPTDKIITQSQRQTLTKQRVSAGDHMLARFDYGDTQDINKTIEQKIIQTLEETYPESDAVIISDYGYGVMTASIIKKIKKLQKQHQKILFVDSKYLKKYKDLKPMVVKPNYREAAALLGVTSPENVKKRPELISKHQNKILKLTGTSIAAVTLDTDGGVMLEHGKPPYRTYTNPVKNSKAVGAGDTYTSTFALSLAAGLSTQTSAELAAAAATLVAQKQGTSSCSQAELKFFFSTYNKHINDVRDLEILVKKYKEMGKRIIFTNGCFDILHSGHVHYLSQAKSLGDILIVGLNSDKSIKRIKGSERPINTLSERIEVLSGLSSIDHITPFTENTPVNLIKIIKPDIFVKGGDYTRDTLPEAPIVKDLGGKVEIIPLIPGRSTTNIIEKIKQKTEKNDQVKQAVGQA